MTTRRRCPVCFRHVTPTRHRTVAGHLDKAGRPCPFSGEDIDNALKVAA